MYYKDPKDHVTVSFHDILLGKLQVNKTRISAYNYSGNLVTVRGERAGQTRQGLPKDCTIQQVLAILQERRKSTSIIRQMALVGGKESRQLQFIDMQKFKSFWFVELGFALVLGPWCLVVGLT